MRQLRLLMGMLLCLNAAYSQSPPPDITIEDTIGITRERYRDTCFGLINKNTTNIPSGYLLDYALSGLDPDKWDGVGTNDTIKYANQFFYFYNILELAAVNANATLGSTDELYVTAKRNLRDNAAVPIAFLYQPYQKINVNAYTNNLLSFTSDSIRLTDVPGRLSSPYDNKQLFVFTPMRSKFEQFGAIVFSLPSALWKMPGVTSVSIDFGDGVGPRTLTANSTAYVNYYSDGYKYITASITVSGNTRTTKTRIWYKRPETYVEPDTTWTVTVEPLYTSEEDYLADARTGHKSTTICTELPIFEQVDCDINPGAVIRVINGCDDVFDRPIIIVDGFDVDPTPNIRDLIDKFNEDGFVDLMLLQGFDFVFVDFTKPRDYVENNAKVLEEIINDVNAIKLNNAEGTVIGYSMGGLIARFCLRDMEDRNIDHEMNTYISVDAPHQGANLPLGIQYLFHEMAIDLPFLRFDEEFQQLSESANSPAAKQELVTKADYLPNNLPSPFIVNPLRSRFAQKLENLGYPEDVTRHAISFGRGNNTANTRDAGNGAQFGNFVPGSQILDGKMSVALFSIFALAYASSENGNNDYVARYRFMGQKPVTIFGIPVGWFPLVRTRNFKYAGQFPYDVAPGGYATSQTMFANALSRFTFGNPSDNEGHRGHCFIPTVSALDLQNQNYSATTRWQSNNLFFNIDALIQNPATVTGNNLTNPALSPFDFVHTYTSDCGLLVTCRAEDDMDGDGDEEDPGANWNLDHTVDVAFAAQQYMERKIRATDPFDGCPAVCTGPPAINGDAQVCVDEADYNIANINLNGMRINWQSVNGFFTVVRGQGTPNVTISPNGSGSDIIRVTITNFCGQSRTLQMNVQFGAFTPTFDIFAPNGYCIGSSYQVLAVPNNPTPVTYNWWVNNVLSTNHTFKLIGNFAANTTRIEVQVVRNGCFSARYGVTYICGNLRVAPNPATSTVTLNYDGYIREVRIIDRLGVTKKVQQFSGKTKSVTLNVSDLRPDVYTLRIFDGQNWSTKQLSVQK